MDALGAWVEEFHLIKLNTKIVMQNIKKPCRAFSIKQYTIADARFGHSFLCYHKPKQHLD